MKRTTIGGGVALVLAIFWGCSHSNQNEAQRTSGSTEVTQCTICHGIDGDPAPPRSLTGATRVTDRGVGAHQIHLQGGRISGSVSCESCHLVPLFNGDRGHLDSALPAEVTYSQLATLDGAQPQWNGMTCAGTYCHGATLTGGSNTEPAWTIVDGSEVTCGSCHGLPPQAPHPTGDRCQNCHSQVVNAEREIINVDLHINGRIDVRYTSGCNSCHGSETNAAPPIDTLGNESTSATGVGAHQAHLEGGQLSRGVSCESCHVVPLTNEDPGHLDSDLPAEIVYSELAILDGANPQWNGTTCAGTYCHGATLTGGSNTEPAWTIVDGSEVTCGSCHGLPPQAPHPGGDQCQNCHNQVVNAAREIINIDLHMNGTVDIGFTSDCSACHGNRTNTAPPVDTLGNISVSERGVGAHQVHMGAGQISNPIACSECHQIPNAVNAPGHIDTDLPAELTFGSLATAWGSNPQWNGATCANVYCHGATLQGGINTEPNWTYSGHGGPFGCEECHGSQITCSSCHALMPPAPHPASDRCELCHADVVRADRTIRNLALHVNGQTDLTIGDLACNDCHGNRLNDAPPFDTQGNALFGFRGVGAHQKHMRAGALSVAVACDECHTVPSHWSSPGHIDTALPAEMVFGALASTGGVSPTWDGSQCNNTYCHNPVPDDATSGLVTEPIWTLVNQGQTDCGSCHGLPPQTATHLPVASCVACHAETVGPDNRTIVDPTKHINGIVEVSTANLACNACHGGVVNDAPPIDVSGNTQTSFRGVGAHQAHLVDSDRSLAVPCTECHVVPAQLSDPGHVDSMLPAEVTFGSVASAQGQNPTWDPQAGALTCAETWCHKPDQGAPTSTPQWTNVTGAPLGCDSCHAWPPAEPKGSTGGPHQVPNATDCTICHPINSEWQDGEIVIRDPARHVDGIVDFFN